MSRKLKMQERRDWVKSQRKADDKKITQCQGLVKQELARCSRNHHRILRSIRIWEGNENR